MEQPIELDEQVAGDAGNDGERSADRLGKTSSGSAWESEGDRSQ